VFVRIYHHPRLLYLLRAINRAKGGLGSGVVRHRLPGGWHLMDNGLVLRRIQGWPREIRITRCQKCRISIHDWYFWCFSKGCGLCWNTEINSSAAKVNINFEIESAVVSLRSPLICIVVIVKRQH